VERRRRGDRVATTNVFRITAKNLSGKDVNLSIIDQIPVAQDGEIKVTYGSEARRALRGAEFPGQLQWIAQLKPGKSEQVEFDFTIEYPESWKRDLEANNRNVMVNKKQVMEKMAKEGLNNFEIENQSDAVSQEMAW
ncbi:MAG: DUF4139 domain-containing protein, partial [Planctomycetes bacterium]|nr:DUF4139 domain-containing protein [Planctomycetota bacterium]